MQTKAQILVSGDTALPTGPGPVRSLNDGVQVRWEWDAANDKRVGGYQVTDENGVVVQPFVQGLGFAESVTGPAMARRIYSISRSGIRSSEYAALTSIQPTDVAWSNITGAVIDSDGSLLKTAATGWNNAGGTMSVALFTNSIEARLRFPVDRADRARAFGFSRYASGVNDIADFHFGVHLKADGSADAVYIDAGSPETDPIDDYEAGQELEIVIQTPPAIGEYGSIILNRITYTGETRNVQQLFVFPELVQYFPLFPAVAIYTQGDSIPARMSITGELVPQSGDLVTAGILVGAAYDGETFTDTILTGYPNSGASTAETLPVENDGDFEFSVADGVCCTVGLGWEDLNPAPLSIPFALRFLDDYSVELWIDGVYVRTLTDTTAPAHRWTMGREGDGLRARHDGKLVAAYESEGGGFAAMLTDPLLLDISFDDTGAPGEVVNVRRRQPLSTEADRDTGDRAAMAVSMEKTRVGGNALGDIPVFDLTGAQPGDELVVKSAGVTYKRPDFSDQQTVVAGGAIAHFFTIVNSASPLTVYPNPKTFPYCVIKSIGTGTVTVHSSGDNIDGAGTKTLNQWDVIRLAWDSTAESWRVV